MKKTHKGAFNLNLVSGKSEEELMESICLFLVARRIEFKQVLRLIVTSYFRR